MAAGGHRRGHIHQVHHLPAQKLTQGVRLCRENYFRHLRPRSAHRLRFQLQILHQIYGLVFLSLHSSPHVQFWNLAPPPYTTVGIMTDQKKTRRQVLEEFVQKSPGDAFSRYGLAMECMSTGDASAAISSFESLLQQHADYIPAYLMYGQLLVRESRPDEAKQILTTGIAAAGKKGDEHAVSEMQALLSDIS